MHCETVNAKHDIGAQRKLMLLVYSRKAGQKKEFWVAKGPLLFYWMMRGLRERATLSFVLYIDFAPL